LITVLSAILVAAIASRNASPMSDSVLRYAFEAILSLLALFAAIGMLAVIIRSSTQMHEEIYPRPSRIGSLAWLWEWFISVAVAIVSEIVTIGARIALGAVWHSDHRH
jgi:hypothetical protein